MKNKVIIPSAPSHDWEVEQALHTLTEAERHRRDPNMMAKVSKLAAEKKTHLARVARMKPTKAVKSVSQPKKR